MAKQAGCENTTTTDDAPDRRNNPFCIASDMEGALWVIGRAVTTLRVLAESDDPNLEIGDALHFVAESLDGPIEDLKQKQDKLFHILHAPYGPKPVAGE